jgi:hypothetical protein
VKCCLVRLTRAAGAMLAAGMCVASLTACGGAPASSGAPSSDRQYSANVAELIDQLHQDLVVSGDQASGLDAARKALHDSSRLYAMLVVYGDFGSCGRMLRNVGVAGAKFGRVDATLGSACGYLERAATLFTAAATRSDARALLAASRTTLKASPLLYRAKAELLAASARG